MSDMYVFKVDEMTWYTIYQHQDPLNGFPERKYYPLSWPSIHPLELTADNKTVLMLNSGKLWSFNVNYISFNLTVFWRVIPVSEDNIPDARLSNYKIGISESQNLIISQGDYLINPMMNSMRQFNYISWIINLNGSDLPHWESLILPPRANYLDRIYCIKRTAIPNNLLIISAFSFWILDLNESRLSFLTVYGVDSLNARMDFAISSVDGYTYLIYGGLINSSLYETDFGYISDVPISQTIAEFSLINRSLRFDEISTEPTTENLKVNNNLITISFEIYVILLESFFALMIVIALAIYRIRNRKESNELKVVAEANLKKPDTTIIDQTLCTDDYEGLYYPVFLLSIYNKDYKVGKRIASGGGGEVFIGKLINQGFIGRNEGKTTCIIKTIFDHHSDEYAFLQEISIMWKFRNEKNFSKLICYSDEPKAMVMKFYPLGSLDNFIHYKKKNLELNAITYSLKNVLRIVKDIALAINIMHKEGFTHNDLKPANILIEKNDTDILTPVLTDFGLSTVILGKAEVLGAFRVVNIKGASLQYAAPELFLSYMKKQKSSQSFKKVNAEIYSFGMITYEIFCKRRPWTDIQQNEIQTLVCRGKRPDINHLYDMKFDEGVIQKIRNMIIECWEQNPEKRPTINSIVEELSHTFLMYDISNPSY